MEASSPLSVREELLCRIRVLIVLVVLVRHVPGPWPRGPPLAPGLELLRADHPQLGFLRGLGLLNLGLVLFSPLSLTGRSQIVGRTG